MWAQCITLECSMSGTNKRFRRHPLGPPAVARSTSASTCHVTGPTTRCKGRMVSGSLAGRALDYTGGTEHQPYHPLSPVGMAGEPEPAEEKRPPGLT